MDESIRAEFVKMLEFNGQRVYNATDPDEVSKAMNDYQKSADIVLRYDIASDAHDESLEKTYNDQTNEEIRRQDALREAELKREIEAKKNRNDFWLKVGVYSGGLVIYGLVAVVSFIFDGKGVIITSTQGKTTIPSAARKLVDLFKI